MTHQCLEDVEFQRAIAIFRPSMAVLNQAKLCLREFLSQHETEVDQTCCLAQIAVFVAESSQQVKDLKGRKVLGIGLGLSRLISNSPCPQELLGHLQQFVNCISIESQQKNEIKQCLIKIRTMYSYVQKFNYYIEALELITEETVENMRYKELFIELAWMLYLDCKENYLRSELSIQNEERSDYLLASVLYFMIRYSLSYIFPKRLRNERHSEKRVMIAHILELLLDVFQIQDIELFKKISDKFDEYGENLIDRYILRTTGCEVDFFSPFIIHLNFKQLQNRYQKALQSKDIDFRILRNQKSISPINKQALFHRVGLKKQQFQTKMISKEFRSHKALNYDESSSDLERNNPEISQNRRSSHSFDAESGNAMSQGVNLQIYRYVKSLTKELRRSTKPSNDKILKQIQIMAQRSSFQLSITKQCFEMTTYSVYEGLSSQNLIENEMLDSALAICIFIVSQMYSQSLQSNLIFSYLENKSCSTLVNLWTCLNWPIVHCENVAPKLQKQFEQQKEQIICDLIWKDNDYIDQIAQLAANYFKIQKFIKFSQGLLLYCESFIKELQVRLNLSRRHCLCAYNCLKFILSANGNVIMNRNLDQILMCCIYIAGKVSEAPVLFSSIKQAYESLNEFNHARCQSIFNDVYLNENEVVDIITFYNKCFIENVQPFVPYMANPCLELLHSLFQRELQMVRQNFLNSVDIADLIETKKPKPPTKLQEGLGMMIKSNRNQTKLRARPQNLTVYELCETERVRRSNEEGEQSHYQ